MSKRKPLPVPPAPVATPQPTTKVVGARFTLSVIERFDKLAQHLSKPGISCTRSQAMRHIVLSYLGEAEHDTDGASTRKPTKTPKKEAT